MIDLETDLRVCSVVLRCILNSCPVQRRRRFDAGRQHEVDGGLGRAQAPVTVVNIEVINYMGPGESRHIPVGGYLGSQRSMDIPT